MKKMKNKSIVSMLLVIIMVASLAFTVLPSIKAEATSPLGLKFNGISEGTWFFGKTSSGTVENGFYKVAAKIDGEAHEVVMEYDGNQFMIYTGFFSGTPGTNSKTPTTSLDLEKSAILTKVDSNGWSAISEGASYVLGNEVQLVYENGEWVQTALTPIEIGIKYNGIAGGNWFFGQSTSVDLMNQFYQVEALLDGVATTVMMEYSSDGMQFIMYGSGFPSTYNPTTSIKFAKGAVLSPYNHSGGWVAVEGGQTYVLGNTLEVVYDSSNSSWAEKKEEVLPIAIKLGFNGISNGNWFFSQKTQTAPSGFYKVPVEINGTAHEAVLSYENGQMIIYSNFFSGTPGSNFITPTTAFKIAKDAILTPVSTSGWSAIEDGQTYIVSEELSLVYENNTWINANNRPVVITPIAIKLGFNGISNGNWFFSQETQTAPSGFYKVAVEINGTAHEAVMEYGNDQMMIYSNFFSGTPGSNFITPTTAFKIAKDAVLTPVDPNNSWGTIADGQTYKVSENLNLAYEDGVWADPATVEKSTISISGYSWSDSVTFGVKIGNTKELDKAKWYSKIVTEQNNTWVSVAGKVIADGVEKEVSIDFPGNGEVFIRVGGKAESRIVIKKETVFASIDGKIRVNFNKNYEIDLNENFIYEEGKRPVEKTPMKITMEYNKVSNAIFDFLGKTTGNRGLQSGFYRMNAIVDGVETSVILEYAENSGLFYIYPHCFTAVPTAGDSIYPTETFEVKKGTVLTPVIQDVWSKNFAGQPYVMTNSVSLVLENGVWMTSKDKAIYDKYEPLEVKVSFEYVQGRSLVLKVQTANGKTIQEIYGDWTTAYGAVKRGIIDETTGTYTFATDSQAAYSLTGEYFYMYGLRLSELDAVRIKAGTILYPDKTCKTRQPIKIVNSFCMVRDAKDKWVVDDEGGATEGVFTSPATGDNNQFSYMWLALIVASICIVVCTKKGRGAKKSGNLEK